MARNVEELNILLNGLDVAFKSGYVTELGGIEHASIMLTLSFDKRETWQYGYLENSSYIKLAWHSDGVLKMLCQSKLSKKFRQCTCLDVDKALLKINKFIDSLEL